ncbi:hypothetical protein [Corallococcus exiguus]|uniref:hypothetical protein n=1 Tax=Corallococcus exiguus TaxID=83462 RepID=UPI0014945CEB|nr:hypothetical protein [Corallococcus exiguus]NPD27731.1 hypothetical protein [Corallococcus exiguus]
MDEFELPPLELDLLAPFGDSVPGEVLLSFARLLIDYRSFRPPLEKQELLCRLAVLTILYGDDRVALEASLALKQSHEPATRVSQVLNYLRERGLRSEREVIGAGRYLSYLLAGAPPVRAATVAALGHWKQGLLRRGVAYIIPELEDSEREKIAPKI